VGKSTLANALLGEARQRTHEVRADDSRGRHTTTTRELLRLPNGALLVDTPGIRALEVTGAADGLDDTFAEIADLAASCRFNDCRHEGEPGCAVLAAQERGDLAWDRLEGYRKLEREAAHAARAIDPLARAEERKKWKAIHKSVGVHMKSKYGEAL
jgi:ribosome biogenesis GTPase